MQYTKLGNTGITVSRICLGCMSYGDKKWREWTIGADEAREHFEIALEAGVSDNLYAIDVEEGEILWKKHFQYSSETPQSTTSFWLCPGGLTATPVVPLRLARRRRPRDRRPGRSNRR